MKVWLRGFFMACMNYSVIPVPSFPWEEENFRYMLAFFPLVGLMEGMCFYGGARWLAGSGLPSLFRASLLTLFPLFFTGGFHMDGFMDTMDGLFCGGEKKKKLEVMKDSRIGAFGAMGLMAYTLLFFSLCASLEDKDTVLLFSLGFVLSRLGSGLSLLLFPHAGEGSASYAASHTEKKIVIPIYIFLFLLTASGFCLLDISLAPLLLLFWCVSFLLYYGFSKKQFGGITGDVAGFYLQAAELFFLMLLTVVKAYK